MIYANKKVNIEQSAVESQGASLFEGGGPTPSGVGGEYNGVNFMKETNHKNYKLEKYAREMRKNQTNEERKLWYNYLKKIRPQFHRQKIFGNYIVDFYCPQLKIIIEVDGIQHYDEKTLIYDKKRTEFLEEQGYTVIRFDNSEVNRDYYNTLYRISNHCEEKAEQLNIELVLPKEV